MTEPQRQDRPESAPGQNLPRAAAFEEPSTALQPYRGAVVVEPDEAAISIERYLRILQRRKWLLLSVALTVLFLVALQVFTATPIYRATATLQIDPEDQKVLPYEQIESSALGGPRDMEQYLWTQTEKLRSRSLAQRVVDKLSLTKEPGFVKEPRKGLLVDVIRGARRLGRRLFREPGDARATIESKAVPAFLNRLTVQPTRNTRLIAVSFRTPDPELSARIANTISEEFIEQHLEGKFEATARATEFLEKQLQDLQIKVEQSEQILLRYAQQQNIVNLSERETIARKRLTDLSDELTRAETAYLAQQARYAATRAASSESFPEVLKTETMRVIEQQLSMLEGQLAGLSSVYGPEWPQVKSLTSQIAGLKAQLGAQREFALESARQEAALAGDGLAKLQAAVRDQRALVDQLNEASIQYNILKRESESNKELYEGLLQRLKEASVAAGLRSSNIRVADAAGVPRNPAAPRKKSALALALMMGLILGTIVAFVVDTLDNTLKSADDVTESLGLPGLGVVPHFELAGSSSQLRFGRSRRAPIRFPIVAFDDDRVKGRNRVLEAYRTLRTSILLSHSGKPPQVILVTSALPGEGKTTTTANTAIALAQTGARTLLLDLDMRKPTLGSVFDVPSAEGMSTYLSGNSDLSSQIQRTSFPNLFVVPAGPLAPNPAELLGSERLRTGLELVREYFTYVVVDSPPGLEISDAVMLSTSVDGVILVARAGKTPRKAVSRCAAQILAVGGKLLGILLNDADLHQPGYGYYGYSGGYYGHYFEDEPKKTA